LARTGRLCDAAIARAMSALSACAARIAARPVAKVGCIATQACRAAENGRDFLERVKNELGLSFSIIEPAEEARLAALGCASLVDPYAEGALIVDIGGGSTELTWVDATSAAQICAGDLAAANIDWISAPVGVVSAAEHWPEPEPPGRWFEDMVEEMIPWVSAPFARVAEARALIAQGRAHIVGTSGTVTSLAGVHLNLPRYRRTLVDGVWMTRSECAAAVSKLRATTRAERAAHPCIGRERADLVLPGCAILEAVLTLWPSERLRVADRGLREGVLMTLMAGLRD
jgi:exopolyphosphatase/guanosine-5'-triphosphate,3'-diphosphate pyrophosphatase